MSCTASLASDRPKRGDHRVHVAVWDGAAVTVTSLVFEKGRRTREQEERLSSRLTLRAIMLACGLPPLALPDLVPGESVAVAQHSVDRPLERLLDASVGSLMYYGPGAFVADEPLIAAVLSGSFNPLHDGHYRLARAAARRLGLPVVYELSVYNVDKPPLSPAEIERRLAQFVDRPRRVVLTCEPLYSGKAALLPGCTFVIGYDTAARLVDPRYYHGDPGAVRAALRAIREQGCRFLIAGRLVDGVFRTLADVDVPDGFDDLFDSLPEDDFRLDLSSTDLRERGIWLPDT